MTTEELMVRISADISELQRELNKGRQEVENFGKKGKASFATFNEAMSKVGATANKAVGIAATAIAGATTALLALGASTQEFRNNQAKLITAFEAAGSSAETATATYNDLYRVLGDDGQAVEAANHLAQLTQNQKDLEEWTNICQGVYATFGDSLPIEGLTEAANETAKVGTLTGSLADALNWAGVNEEAFQAQLDACNTEAEREALIRETLNGLYDDAATKYEENNAQILAQNEAQARMNEATAELGRVMAPINTALTEFGAAILEQIAPAITDFVENYGESFKQLLEKIATALGAVIKWITDNIGIIGTVAGVILAIVAAINLYNAAMAIYNIVMAPVNLTILAIVAAIIALIAIITACIVYWDEIKAVAVAVWEAIVNAVKVAVDWIVELFNKVVGFVKENWQGLLLLLVNPFAGAFKLIYDNCEGFRNMVDNVLAQVKQFFANLWENIKRIFANVGSWFSEKFKAAYNGIKNVFSSIGGFFRGIWNTITSIFKNVGSTIANAITNTVKTAINRVLSGAVKIINGFISAINFAIDIINAIPGVKISRLSQLEVPQLAKGGIATGDTLAHIGEDGYKEAVLPLDRNTEWMDMLATRLARQIGGNTPVVLNVDGKVFAETAINTINQRTRQTGKLALNLV